MNFNKKHFLTTILFPIQIIIVQVISSKTTLIETYYSNGIYPKVSTILRSLLGWLPFSFGDVLIILLVIIFVIKLFSMIKNKGKNLINDLLHFGSILSILYFCFYFFWGLNYFREPLTKKLDLNTSSNYTNQTLINTTKKIIKKLNTIHYTITKNDSVKVNIPFTNKELFNKATKGYDLLSDKFPDFSYLKPSVKNSLISLIQSYNGTSGYINPITGEAQINEMIPKTGMPATICHEMAHQIGWNAEDEANFIGFLTASINPDLYFQYSAYRMAFRYLIVEVKKRNENQYKNLWKLVNKGINKDFNDSYKHWRKFDNPIEPYIKKGYNSYLKANNQEKGIDSYDYVVDLLISYLNKN